jgi:hypothetical protein
MTERRQSTDRSSQPGHRPDAPPDRATSAELHAIVERAAHLEGGLALLESAALECAAVLLGVAPRQVERIRLALRDPHARAEVAALLTALAAVPAAPPVRPPRPAAPRDPEQLAQAARQRADGLSLLFSACPEAAAIAFGVHPDLVPGARKIADRRAGPPRD